MKQYLKQTIEELQEEIKILRAKNKSQALRLIEASESLKAIQEIAKRRV